MVGRRLDVVEFVELVRIGLGRIWVLSIEGHLPRPVLRLLVAPNRCERARARCDLAVPGGRGDRRRPDDHVAGGARRRGPGALRP